MTSAAGLLGFGARRTAAAGGGGGGGGGAATPAIIWRPGVPSAGNAVATWAEVQAAIAANVGDLIVRVDTSFGAATIPGGTITQCFGRTQFVSYTFGLGTTTITFANGAQVFNPYRFTNLFLTGLNTLFPFITLDVASGGLILDNGTVATLEVGSTLAFVRHAATFTELALFQGARVVNNSVFAGVGFATVLDGLVAVFAVVAMAGSGTASYGANTYSGSAAPGTTLVAVTDASAPFVAQTFFAGTVVAQPFDKAAGVTYDDALVLPPLGAADVQAAIDALKGNWGVYTPVASLVSAAITAIAPFEAHWLRVGNVVTVAGGVDLTFGIAGGGGFDLDLPVPSALAGGYFRLGGAFGVSKISTIPQLFGQPGAPGTARFVWGNGGGLGLTSLEYTYTYLIN